MKNLKVIAFTHKKVDLKDLGKLVISDELIESYLLSLKNQLAISEIFYINTCNRIEFVFTHEEALNSSFVETFLSTLSIGVDIPKLASQAVFYESVEALNHLFRVSCSLESLVVGEKEILAQLRQSFEKCKALGLTGDYLRLIMDQVVKTAKSVYTDTQIACNPISVVSLAYRELRKVNTFTNARVLLVGAGETNQLIAKYLQKHKYSNFAVFNRTLSKAQALAADLNGEAFPLEDLSTYNKGFDILITCTSSVEPIITPEVYTHLLAGDTDKKLVLDLAIPNDTHPDVLKNNSIHFIEVYGLQEVAERNKQERYHELINAEKIIEQHLEEFKQILKQRRIELAMRQVPERIKEIKETALNSVFAADIQNLDPKSVVVLEKVIAYMEKKYISVPMVMAKEILVDNC